MDFEGGSNCREHNFSLEKDTKENLKACDGRQCES